MSKAFLRCLFIFLIVGIFSGCETIKEKARATKEEMDKISVRGYIQDKARVDQEIQGSVGNWENAPMAEDPERKMTRKIYFLEFSKEADPSTVSDEFYEHESGAVETMESTSGGATEESTKKRRFRFPSFGGGDEEEAVDGSSTGGATTFTEYKVEKDDTLQKISKKFYNSYSKWPKIYEANKAQINNPDAIQPGIVIRIPVE